MKSRYCFIQLTVNGNKYMPIFHYFLAEALSLMWHNGRSTNHLASQWALVEPEQCQLDAHLLQSVLYLPFLLVLSKGQ